MAASLLNRLFHIFYNMFPLRTPPYEEGVCLSTFHGSKVLEWETVFIVDANEGVCPYKKAITEEEIEEERRMFYVAMTRARDNLQMCYTMDPAKNINVSRFLKQEV